MPLILPHSGEGRSGNILKNMGVDEKGEKLLIAADRTFFCSELVAKACKVLGIIQDDDTSSAKFFPAHFSSRYDNFCKFTKGTTVEPELMVIMDRDELIEENPSENYYS